MYFCIEKSLPSNDYFDCLRMDFKYKILKFAPPPKQRASKWQK